jgi:hypothetical protein
MLPTCPTCRCRLSLATRLRACSSRHSFSLLSLSPSPRLASPSRVANATSVGTEVSPLYLLYPQFLLIALVDISCLPGKYTEFRAREQELRYFVSTRHCCATCHSTPPNLVSTISSDVVSECFQASPRHSRVSRKKILTQTTRCTDWVPYKKGVLSESPRSVVFPPLLHLFMLLQVNPPFHIR